MRNLICLFLLGMIVVMVGCTPIRTKTPLATCPLAQKIVRFDNGAIFQPAAIRPLFEDRHARNVGDELTVMLGEPPATDKSSANAAKPGKVNATLPTAKGEDEINRTLEREAMDGRIILVASHRPMTIAAASNTIRIAAR